MYKRQGKNYNPFTGEEPGKIPHEWPGVNLRGKNTLFAAADTTLLFLIGIGIYYEWVKEKKFIKENSSYIYNALEYVKRHLKDNLFWDSPSYCHSNSFALYSTCWRDIGYPERKNRKHLWPASYLMVNILLVKALRILARLSELDILFLDKQYLKKQAEKTRRKILKEFWISKEGYFASAIDMKGKIKTLYLDSLWSLYFLEKNDIEKSKIKKVFKNLKKLETPYGYITRENKLGYEYKGGIKKIECTIWPWENAYLAIVAERFGFYNIKEKCFFPVRALKISKYPFTEYLQYKKSKIPLPKGCNVQLWTIAYVKAMYEMITTKTVSYTHLTLPTKA